jgi:dihydrofolate reductase
MRKVVVYTLLSLDGVAESPDRYIFDFDEEMYANLGRVIETQDAVLLGRRTYDDWAGYWPEATNEPFASFVNGTPKYVATSTRPKQAWANSTVIEGPVPEFVRNLKRQPGADIGVHGSIELARSLVESRLVDELRLVIAPVVVGGGRRLFDDREQLHRMQLLRSTGTPSGALLADYRVVQNG